MVTRNGTTTEVKNYLEGVTFATSVLTTPAQEYIDGLITGWILTVESTLIILTNLLVAIALVVLIRKRGYQSWCFVLNLAIADILVGLAITAIAYDALKGRIAYINIDVCLLRMSFVVTATATSMFTMFVISVDRYVAIKLPLRYSQIMAKKLIVGALLCLWLLSTFVGFLPKMVKEMQHRHSGRICTFFSVINPKSCIIVFSVAFFPILLVFIYFYLDILKIAWSHQQRIQRAMQVHSFCQVPSHFWMHVKALKMVAVLVGCFTLCWCPFFVVGVVQVLCPSCKLYMFLENHLWMLGVSNSLINPLVYAFWHKEVRQQIFDIFASFKCCMKASNGTVHVDQAIATQGRNSLDHELCC